MQHFVLDETAFMKAHPVLSIKEILEEKTGKDKALKVAQLSNYMVLTLLTRFDQFNLIKH